jgi:hypothetical protein
VTEPEFWTYATMADDLGISVAGMYAHNNRARHRRSCRTPGCKALGESTCNGLGPQPGDLPPADKVFGRSPVWYDATYQAWKAGRTGRRAGRKK